MVEGQQRVVGWVRGERRHSSTATHAFLHSPVAPELHGTHLIQQEKERSRVQEQDEGPLILTDRSVAWPLPACTRMQACIHARMDAHLWRALQLLFGHCMREGPYKSMHARLPSLGLLRRDLERKVAITLCETGTDFLFSMACEW